MILALADSSALIRAWRGRVDVTAPTDGPLAEGEIAVCPAVRVEILRGARNGAEALALDAELDRMRELPTDDAAWLLARRTVIQLAHLPGGRHRGPSLSDVLIAATAERHGVAVLHDDADFDLIAGVTGQPVERIAA